MGHDDQVASPLQLIFVGIPRIQIRCKEQCVRKLLPHRLEDQERIISIPPQDSDGLDLLALLFRFAPSPGLIILLVLSLNSSHQSANIVELRRHILYQMRSRVS